MEFNAYSCLFFTVVNIQRIKISHHVQNFRFGIFHRKQITFSCMQDEEYSLCTIQQEPALLGPPLKGPQADEQRGSKDNTLRKMLFLLGCRGGSLARDQRHLPVARPTEVLISIFLSAAATSRFLRRSSDRDMYGVIIYARHMA